jgi:hypothetical protein
MPVSPNDRVLIAAIQVLRSWDNKDYLKESMENLRTALKDLMEKL